MAKGSETKIDQTKPSIFQQVPVSFAIDYFKSVIRLKTEKLH
ncbi:Uncharacterised protein [Streptococcus macacae NCTC 11558]|uniref:Uncharacterized protein n=1 Tax=Streptococcus macacae NCTC 11558 TaxID=764298 RepID=G5JYR8_9STRE|nr:hypothetical protein STRMA_0332 [Streptococcus macacae NCTC 11558]SUN78177.1 Uncharacterised protein [Streptococcus macacae NCTC 11558]